MAKLILNDLANLQNENTAVSTINNNSNAIETAMENTLSRDGTAPNQMGANLDMNSWHISNLPEPSSDTDPIRLIDLTNVSQVTNVLHTASSSSVLIGTGTKTFTVPSGLGFFTGQYVLIQVSGSPNNYMLGRVTSYSGTTLVMNMTVTAGSGTFNNWLIDLSGPQGPLSIVYDTVTNAIAATIDPTVSFLPLAGRAAIGDGGDGLYDREVSMPADQGRFQSADGSWWHLVSRAVTPEMFGAKGDGTTDDRANLQTCFDFVSGRGGGVVDLTPNKNYRVVITSNLTGLDLSPNVTLRLNNSTISFECNGQVYGLRIMTGTRLYGPGTVRTTSSTGLGPFFTNQAIWHAPLTFGTGYGDSGTVAAPNPYVFSHDWIVDGVTVTSVRNDGGATIIGGYGDLYNGVIRNCIIPDNSTTACAIGFDWIPLGNLTSSDLNLSKTNYNAGTAYSLHPHHIVIENNSIGNMSMPYFTVPSIFGSHGIRLSGIYDCVVRNNSIESTTYAGIFITGGDLSFEFAPGVIRYNAMKDILIEGNNIKNANNGYGIFWDAYPDNVYAGVIAATYVPLFYYDGYFNNGIIRGNKLVGDANGNSLYEGILCVFTRGLTIEDNYVQGFIRGIRIYGGSKKVSVLRNDVTIAYNGGITVTESGSNPPQNTLVSRNWCHRNCSSGSTEGNIYINLASDTIVDDNYLGSNDEDNSLYGIVVDTSSTYTSVTNNFVYQTKASGTAFRFLQTNNNTAIWVFRDNRYVGADTFLTGPQIMPVRREYSVAVPGLIITHAEAQRNILPGDNTPPWGTWGLGSTILNVDATNTGEGAMSKCTSSGTPGTWKRLITLP